MVNGTQTDPPAPPNRIPGSAHVPDGYFIARLYGLLTEEFGRSVLQLKKLCSFVSIAVTAVQFSMERQTSKSVQFRSQKRISTSIGCTTSSNRSFTPQTQMTLVGRHSDHATGKTWPLYTSDDGFLITFQVGQKIERERQRVGERSVP